MKKIYSSETTQAIKVFREYCAKKKMRYTLERETIIKAIYSDRGHFHIDHLFSNLRKNNPDCRIAKTSIYRSVPFLLDAGILRESVADSGHVLYERTLGHFDHDHFRCIGCGCIVEFSSPDLVLAQRKICEKQRFTVLWRTNVINGYCRNCSKKQFREKRT